MKSRHTIVGISVGTSVLALLLAAAPGRSLAMDSIASTSGEQAEALGMVVRSKAAGPDAVWVELEFETKGKLMDISHVRLDMRDAKKLLVSSTLQSRSGPGRIVVNFTVDRSNLDKFTLTALTPSVLGSTGYELRVKDFVDLQKVR